MKGYFAVLLFVCGSISLLGQPVGIAGTVQGSVVDPTGAVILKADVTLENEFTQYRQVKTTDESGKFAFTNVPPAQYHLIVSAAGFQISHTDLLVRSKVPVELKVTLALGTRSEAVQVHADTLLETAPVSHSTINEGVFSKLPTSTTASGLSDIITLATPGVVADSNGFFHPLGDHAQQSFSVDNQPITDQQGYLFSTGVLHAAVLHVVHPHPVEAGIGRDLGFAIRIGRDLVTHWSAEIHSR